jgi:hypothetical protein
MPDIEHGLRLAADILTLERFERKNGGPNFQPSVSGPWVRWEDVEAAVKRFCDEACISVITEGLGSSRTMRLESPGCSLLVVGNPAASSPVKKKIPSSLPPRAAAPTETRRYLREGVKLRVIEPIRVSDDLWWPVGTEVWVSQVYGGEDSDSFEAVDASGVEASFAISAGWNEFAWFEFADDAESSSE